MKKAAPTAGIIGAGIAGMALSIRLACRGYRVQVFEANPYVGGKLSEIQESGFRFDAGPSLFTLPEEVDALFRLAGEAPEAHFRYRRLPVSCKYFYEDGTTIEAFAEPERFADELQAKTGADRERVLKAYSNSKMLYDLLNPLFMRRSLHSWKTFLNRDSLKAYGNLHRMDFLRSMNKANEQLLQNQKAVQLFNRYATYNGSNPYEAPGTLNIIPYLEMGLGAYFPEGGMYSISRSLYELAKRLGVQFHLNSPVEKIVVEDKRAIGLQLKGEVLRFDSLISNADMVSTYHRLLPSQKAPRRLLSQPKSSSALIFYWGINRQFPELDLHNIFFSEDYREEFAHIFQKEAIYHDPTVYLNISSKYKPSDAPEGCENWFTMINVPNNSGQDWDKLIKQAREWIIAKLSRQLGVAVESHIIYEQVLDPRLIESKTSSARGALYGNSSNSRYAAFLRHANKSGRIQNLYFCGGSVHPGGGIPLCLLSAKITADFFPQA
ncbi:1-hydroxycarotenoid 3,4-desaturase CrtD [Nafulsella turpanensis]|uniref:1-hydroxycarotenoid 3,4-desaturase CrtD n=1 Tax=Nafulsella turpanensis TaxID=1265690 RepID=UPI000349E965|nr:1-hydroxycarotenoid 3,4-desaturase CrtD [Nafulsella turpanensis]